MTESRAKPRVNYSQIHILSRLRTYLEQEGRDEALIKKLNDGYCSGITSLWLYAKWLALQPNPGNIPRDDLEWFKNTMTLISSWDGIRALMPEEKEEFDRFTSLIEFFQHIPEYLKYGQGNMHLMVEDTRGRKPSMDYSIVSLFTKTQLEALLNEIVHEDHMIHINSNDHALGVFKHDGKYGFFDANRGPRTCNSIAELVDKIFNAYRFDAERPSPLSLKVFRFSGTELQTYPSQEDFLRRYPPGRFVCEAGYAEETNVLSFAVQDNCLGSVRYFLDQGADPNLSESSPIKVAAALGNSAIVAELIDRGVVIDSTDPEVEEEQTLLMVAVEYDRPDTVELLLAKGANIDKKNKVGQTALMKAVISGNEEMVSLLLSKGADPSKKGNFGATALSLAIQRGNARMVSTLIQNGADLSLLGEYVLMRVAGRGDVDVARVLFEAGMDPNARDERGWIPLMYAVEKNHIEAVNFFLARGANVALTSSSGQSALGLAIRNKNMPLVEKLLEKMQEAVVSPLNKKLKINLLVTAVMAVLTVGLAFLFAPAAIASVVLGLVFAARAVGDRNRLASHGKLIEKARELAQEKGSNVDSQEIKSVLGRLTRSVKASQDKYGMSSQRSSMFSSKKRRSTIRSSGHFARTAPRGEVESQQLDRSHRVRMKE